MRTTSRHLVAFLALVLLALSSCQVIRIEDQETLLRHDAAADQLELLLVYRGVSVWSQVKDDPGFLQGDEPEIDPRKLEQAVELAESVLGGRRRFKLLPGWLEMDLDDDDEDLTAADREVLAGIELLEVAAFLDEDGRLSCFQHLRLRGAKRLADHLNALTCEAIVKDLSPEDVAGSDYPQSARLWSRAARESWQWLRFEGPHVVISIPATHEDTARVLLENCREPEAPELFDAVDSLRLGEERVELWLGTHADPVIHVEKTNEDPRYEDALRRRVEAALGHELPIVGAEALRWAFRRGSGSLLEGALAAPGTPR